MYQVVSYNVNEVTEALRRFAQAVSTENPGAFGPALAAMVADGEVEVVGISDGQFVFKLATRK